MRFFALSVVLFAVSVIAAPVPEPEAEAIDARRPPNADAWCGGRACSAYKKE